jgi:hypothetical protein
VDPREVRRAVAAGAEALAELKSADDGLKAVSPAMLARALRAVLVGQQAILGWIERQPAPPARPRPAEDEPARVFEIRPIPPDSLVDDGADEPLFAPPRPRAARRREPPPEAAPAAAPPPPPAPAAAPPPVPDAAPRPPEAGPDFAARFSEAAESVAREAIAAFPVDEVNRWLASGTIFQIRGSLAFLNLRSMGGVKVDELRSHIRRMGFEDEVGRLAAPGLAGEILLFRRPE